MIKIKTINVTFDDEEFNDLSQIKGLATNWHDFIMVLVTPKPKIKEGVKEAKQRIRKEKAVAK